MAKKKVDLGKVAPYELVVDESFSLPFFVKLTSNHIAAFCGISSGLACILSEYLSNQVGMSCCVCAANVIFWGVRILCMQQMVFLSGFPVRSQCHVGT